MTKKVILVIVFVISANIKAQIIKDDNYITHTNRFNLKEVCHFLTKRESPLIDIQSATQLSCMGKIVNVGKFCEHKESMNDFYSRAIVDKKNKQVLCLSSSRVTVKYKCQKENDKFCSSSEEGCFYFKEKLAKKLSLVHHSLQSKRLNCYFNQKSGSDIVTEVLQEN